MVELLAPAGSFEALTAAINAGADAIYFGIRGINMRAGAKADFTIEEMKEVVKRAKESGIKTYLTLNTIIYDDETEKIRTIIKKAKEAGVNAIIAWDLAVIKIAREEGIEIHLSTQGSAANYEAVKEYSKLGIKRVVLARELNLEQIKDIIKKIKEEKLGVEIETFIHGAMCISVSGRCFMSQVAYCKSANRGECLQPCRRSYLIVDEEEGTTFKIENSYVMSPKDLCTMPIIDKIIDAGIDVLKIEGRARSPEYVKVVVESYREAIKLHEKGLLTEEKKQELITRMERVYNKGFETGFYMGRPLMAWAGVYGSKATTTKEYLGRVMNYYKKAGVVEIKLETGSINEGDEYYIIGLTTGVIEEKIKGMRKDDKETSTAKKGDIITFKAPQSRKNDKFYKIITKK